MTRYLSVGNVLSIQIDLIKRYGGALGLRDAGLLEAAVFRPQSGYYPDVIVQAAVLWESLSQNHPFIDGNKRVGFAAAYTFLRLNGFDIEAESETIFVFIDDLYRDGEFSAARLEIWLRSNVAKRTI